MTKSAVSLARAALAIRLRRTDVRQQVLALRTSRSRSSSPSLCCASSSAPTTAARLRRAWGVVRPAARPEAVQGAELLHAVVCRAEADEKGAFARLLSACFDRARCLGLIAPSDDRTVAIDSTGLETRHASMHFRRRVGLKKGVHAAWPKPGGVSHGHPPDWGRGHEPRAESGLHRRLAEARLAAVCRGDASGGHATFTLAACSPTRATTPSTTIRCAARSWASPVR